jgi:hypothetical protein
VQLIDREIEKIVRSTDELREQTRVLHAEWTLQNDPQRLQALADQFLSLKTVTPGQFTSMAELDNRLPAVRPPEPPAPEPAEPHAVPVAQTPPPEEPRPVPVMPIQAPPPKPAAVVAVAAPPSRAAEHEHKPPPRQAIAEVPPIRSVQVAVSPPTLPAPPVMVNTGSALGMARSVSVPPPRPTPVSASQWVTGGGGG